MRGKSLSFKFDESQIIRYVIRKTKQNNIDNIARTKAYLRYYVRHQEIWWSLLASLVSRNAGWNMTDLCNPIYRELLKRKDRKLLFLSYERPNWLIFHDAYPQLLLYELSKKHQRNLFHLLKYFHISSFMQQEWSYFFEHRDVERLTKALIINEQFVIQKPVIEHPLFSKHVFQTLKYHLQEWLQFSFVIFPTLSGKLYGIVVKDFPYVESRITLGKQLMRLLFKMEESSNIQSFALRAEITSSRNDYEKYLGFDTYTHNPLLRRALPVVKYHRRQMKDWSKRVTNIHSLFADVPLPNNIDLTNWYKKKQKQLFVTKKIKETYF